MTRLLTIIGLLLTLTLTLRAQTVDMPQAVTAAVGRLAAVEMTYDGDDFQFSVPPELDAFREYTTDSNVVKLRVIGYQAGTYQVTAVASKAVDGKGLMSPLKSCLIHVVGPAPVPPGPTPVPPGPTPPPVTVGKRTLLIVSESASSTPATGRLITGLRNAPHATYITSKGHKLAVLDDDDVDENGQPTPVLATWRPHLVGMTLPVLFVVDQPTGALVHKESLPATATADTVMATLRAHGG
jgi:hypothetical protein